jgi:hypothetical protein
MGVDYIKELEIRNDELQTALTKSLTIEQVLTEQLRSKYYFIIGVTSRVSGQLFNMEIVHHLFNDGFTACVHLKTHWKAYREDFAVRFGSCGFEFKYFTIDSYNCYKDPLKDKIKPVRAISWSFETRKEVLETIKTLKK